MTDEDLPLAKTEQYFVDAIVKLFKNKRAQGWSDLAILEVCSRGQTAEDTTPLSDLGSGAPGRHRSPRLAPRWERDTLSLQPTEVVDRLSWTDWPRLLMLGAFFVAIVRPAL